MRLLARALDAAAFAPFGVVTPRPVATDTTLIAGIGGAMNLRPGVASPRLGWFATPARAFPVTTRVMERHRFSSQSFLPCDAVDWLVLVAPRDAEGGPDMARAEAFVADAARAVTFHPDVWHHPLTAFAAATFAVLTFLADDADDEEFRTLAEPVTILPGR